MRPIVYGPRGNYASDDTQLLVEAYWRGGATHVHCMAARDSLRRAGLMEPIDRKRPSLMRLTKSGTKRARALYDVATSWPSVRRLLRRDRNRVVHKNRSENPAAPCFYPPFLPHEQS